VLFGIESADGADFYYIEGASVVRPVSVFRIPTKASIRVPGSCFTISAEGRSIRASTRRSTMVMRVETLC